MGVGAIQSYSLLVECGALYEVQPQHISRRCMFLLVCAFFVSSQGTGLLQVVAERFQNKSEDSGATLEQQLALLVE